MLSRSIAALTIIFASIISALLYFNLFVFGKSPDGDESNYAGLSAVESSLYWKGDPREHKSPIKVQYKIVNKASHPIRIVSVRSQCGCAKPVVTPEVLAPGQTGSVDVSVDPPVVGSRRVEFRLYTDVPKFPYLDLELQMQNEKNPPFIVAANGHLSFSGDMDEPDARKLVVYGYARKDNDELPIILDHSKKLEFSLQDKKWKQIRNTGIYSVEYMYDVKLKAPSDSMRSTIDVIDPWVERNVKTVGVHINQQTTGLQTLPSSVTINTNSSLQEARPIRFIVRSIDRIKGLHLDINDSMSENFELTCEQSGESGKVFLCELRARKTQTLGDLSSAIVKIVTNDSSSTVEMDVKVTKE